MIHSKSTKKLSVILLCISIVLMLISSIGASFIQSDFGKVEVTEFKLPTNNGKWISGTLFKPKSASSQNPVPLVVSCHGYLNNNKMQDINAIELSRRGIAVITYDAYFHGNSSSSDADIMTSTIYKNALLGKDPDEMAANHRAMCKNGVIVLNSNNAQFPIDLEILKTPLNHTDINILYATMKQEMYDAVGVPLASSSVTSGGDTGSARQLGNGWENAYNRLLDDINSFLEADQILLEDIISICVQYPKNKVNDLHASEIEIKYSPNMSDNMQIKAQAYVNYTGGNAPIPPEIALSLINATSDPITVGKAIKDWGNELSEKEARNASVKMTQNPVSENGTGEIQKDLQGK